MSGGGAGGSRTTIAPTGTIDAMAMTTGDIVAIERATATMADVMRAVTAVSAADGIPSIIAPKRPQNQQHHRTKKPPRLPRPFPGPTSRRPHPGLLRPAPPK